MLPNLNQLTSLLPDRSHLVTFTVKVNGKAIPSNFSVTSIQVVKGVYRVPYATINLVDGDVAKQEFARSDTNFLTPGNEIDILAGYHSDENSIFKGIIIKHCLKCTNTSSFTLQIECKDIVVKTTVGRKNKYFTNQKDSDIIEEILGDPYNIPNVIEGTPVTHKRMMQFYATDWDFINIRAEANGMLVIADNGKLIIKPPDFEQKPKDVLNFGSSIYEFHAEMDARDQFPMVKATAWNPSNQELLEVEADENGATPSSPLNQGASFAGEVLDAVSNPLGALTDFLGLTEPPNTDFRDVIGLNHWQLQHSGEMEDSELMNWAAAKYIKSQLAKTTGSVKFKGNVNVLPGDTIALNGVGKRHNTPVIVTAVVHDISNGAWFTNAQFGLKQNWFAEEFEDVQDRPSSSLLPAVSGLQIGIVTNLKDPDGKNRVQVKLPLINNDEEGIWARIAAMDAGKEYGAFFRPYVKDEVIVGFINDDPREAIILGMLHSKKHPAPLKSESNENFEKGWVTKSQMKVIFNEDKKSLTIETPAGKKIILDEEENYIHLSDEHQNKIEMTADGILIESGKDLKISAQNEVTIEGVNIKNAATDSFKADGTKRSELTSSTEVVVKGAKVLIN